MNRREVKLCMMEQICGAHDLSKLHLEELLDEGSRTCAKPCVSLHTQICPLVTPSAGTAVNAKSQQPQQ